MQPATPSCASDVPSCSNGSTADESWGQSIGGGTTAAAFALLNQLVSVKGLGKARVLCRPIEEPGHPFRGRCLVEQLGVDGKPTGVTRHVYPRMLHPLREVRGWARGAFTCTRVPQCGSGAVHQVAADCGPSSLTPHTPSSPPPPLSNTLTLPAAAQPADLG